MPGCQLTSRFFKASLRRCTTTARFIPSPLDDVEHVPGGFRPILVGDAFAPGRTKTQQQDFNVLDTQSLALPVAPASLCTLGSKSPPPSPAPPVSSTHDQPPPYQRTSVERGRTHTYPHAHGDENKNAAAGGIKVCNPHRSSLIHQPALRTRSSKDPKVRAGPSCIAVRVRTAPANPPRSEIAAKGFGVRGRHAPARLLQRPELRILVQGKSAPSASVLAALANSIQLSQQQHGRPAGARLGALNEERGRARTRASRSTWRSPSRSRRCMPSLRPMPALIRQPAPGASNRQCAIAPSRPRARADSTPRAGQRSARCISDSTHAHVAHHPFAAAPRTARTRGRILNARARPHVFAARTRQRTRGSRRANASRPSRILLLCVQASRGPPTGGASFVHGRKRATWRVTQSKHAAIPRRIESNDAYPWWNASRTNTAHISALAGAN
ncbi:hypothetical protein B0H17DRAFT_1195834 [Mycena rosella]|uniref:Uncharacterized protein n=1 Tax=Mycena rosella TaxID=1033263 RepID=A0AAD7DV37_MYCRO|nr:hypothetical protein B0H17DRAFT_1195834 [Mycena rosella]